LLDEYSDEDSWPRSHTSRRRVFHDETGFYLSRWLCTANGRDPDKVGL